MVLLTSEMPNRDPPHFGGPRLRYSSDPPRESRTLKDAHESVYGDLDRQVLADQALDLTDIIDRQEADRPRHLVPILAILEDQITRAVGPLRKPDRGELAGWVARDPPGHTGAYP